MEAIQPSEATDWSSVIPLIQAQQRAIAERNRGGEAPETAAVSGSQVARPTESGLSEPEAAPAGAGNRPRDNAGGKTSRAMNDLTDAEERMVDAMKARDSEVRRHEQAHAAVGGSYASAPSYTYQVGPDGKRYAVGGEVQIDVSPVPDDPAATMTKMEVVKAAALAPAEPSSADRKVAAMADAQRAQAAADLTALRAAERRGDVDRRA
ncbi:putative metalloprotease CJM1_0395 family protein [uncultured Roseobacter sp.]|uniref:putative metalloprotease CJM1_0395 family protein n=1 Tax=uncultured Roseobacter sp. TaxID=114847 RepID=UPI002608D9D7|nr:putative metalloprotease CJM1_0395 family protein [uncultured Roseobacter sp.]